MNPADLAMVYADRYAGVLVPVAARLRALLSDHLIAHPRIDSISARAKDPDSFMRKSAKVLENGKLKYADPPGQIQDQIGARIVVLYQSDVASVQKVIERYYHHFEKKAVVPDSSWKFGYFGHHYILSLPEDAVPKALPIEAAPDFFELQVKTVWEHAWSAANHDLGYKPDGDLTPMQERRLAFASAQAWGADEAFETLIQQMRTNRPRLME